MRKLARLVAFSLATCGVVAVAVIAWAYFSTTGAGAGTGNLGTLTAPTNVTANASGTTVTVTWTGVTPPAGGTIGYYVQRFVGASASAACGSSAASLLPSTPTSCSDTGVAAGTYTYKVTAVFRSWSAQSAASNSVTVAAASKLAFTTQPASGASIQATGTGSFAVSVAVQDAGGNTVTTDSRSVTLAIGTNPSSGVLSCTNTGGLTVTAASGVANFTGCAITKAGTGYTLTATSSPSLTAPTNANSFNITAGTASTLSFTQSPSNSTGGVAFPTQAKVTVQDVNGNTVTTDSSTVALSIAAGTPTTGGPGTLSGCTQSESSGVITFSSCAIDTAGNGYKLHATDASLTAADSTAFNVTVGAAAKLAFSQSPSNSTGGVAFPTQAKVTVQDAGGNTVTTDSSTVTLSITSGTPTSGGPGTLSGCTGIETSGVVTFSSCKIDTAGNGYKLHATDASLTAADSTAFNITVGTATKLGFTTQPASGANIQATGTGSFAVSVAVQDAGGNTVTTDSRSVTLAIGTNPSSGVLSCTNTGGLTVTASAGVANFTGCAITKTGTGYTLTATSIAPLTAPANANTFNITAGTASKLVFTTQPGSDAGTGSLSPQPGVSVEDVNGNVEVGDTSTTVTIAIGANPGSGTLACFPSSVPSPPAVSSLTMAVSAGVATFSGCGITQAGGGLTAGYTLTATSSPAHGTVTSTSFSVTKSTPTVTAPNNGAPQTVTGTATTFTVTGTSFASGARVSISNTTDFTLNSYSWIDATHVSVTITAVNAGKKTAVTITNPDGGAGASQVNAVQS